jgi:twinkle protein
MPMIRFPVTIERKVKQFAGNGQMSLPLQDQFFEFVSGNLWLYDQIGTMKWKRIIGISRWAIENLGITQVMIDSLMKCGIRSKDHETQAQFLDELTTLGKNTGAHMHPVAHSVKPSEYDETKPPSKYSTAGSADISNMVDNMLIHFQQKKEPRTYDQMLIVDKQRNPEGNNAEPSFLFTFDEDCFQFKPETFAPTYNPEDWRSALWI